MKNNSVFSPKTSVSIDTFKTSKVERPDLVKGGIGGTGNHGDTIEVIDIINY